MPKDPVDRRVERTRKAVLDAFFDLVQELRYDDITVADIVARAGIGRSAFYAHFAGKDALLAASIAGPFSILADTLRTGNVARLTGLLDHFWANRGLARIILKDPIRRRIVAVLTDQVEAVLDEGGPWKRGPLVMPSRLAAIQLAEMLLTPVTAWLAGESRCSSETLAAALGRVGSAALDAMTLPTPSSRR
jgi:AcrR family transcriptional regulator